MNVGLATTLVLRVSFTGELGYEIYLQPEYHRYLYQELLRIGDSVGIRPFGLRALDSLRMEKGFRSWGREYTQDYTPAEAGLDRLVCTDKLEFIGRSAVLEQLACSPARTLRFLAIEGGDPDPVGGEPVFWRGRAVGRLTSAAYGHSVRHCCGFAYLPSEIAEADQLEVEVLGSRLACRPMAIAPYDPRGERLRS